MKIGVVGAGYVGLVTGACFAEMGNEVLLVDIDESKVESINRKEPPIHEEGLKQLLDRNELRATTDYSDLGRCEVVFICVGTPSNPDGSINLDHVFSAARSISDNTDALVVVKSTVVPGTTSRVRDIVGPRVAVNPEFLREGRAIKDFMDPDKVVVGCESDETFNTLGSLYSNFEDRIVRCDLATAEMVKYANNAFLATKISFINEVANMCEEFGADVGKVAEAIGMDSRISPSFLRAGIGFGGSCFPKDVRAIVEHAKAKGIDTHVLDAVMRRNEGQPGRMVEHLARRIDLEGARVAVLGTAFKPGTDDIREAPSLRIIDTLLEKGADVVAYDPQAMENTERLYKDRISFAGSLAEAVEGSDAALLVTEWPEFADLKKHAGLMKGDVVIDGRLFLDKEEFDGFDFGGVGHG